MDVASKVRALRAKTVERGCTPAEAAAARAMADRLQERHGLSDAQVAPEPERRRPAPPPADSRASFLADLLRRAQEQERAEAARGAYRRSGVHVDPPGVVHPDCTCSACAFAKAEAEMIRRMARAAKRPTHVHVPLTPDDIRRAREAFRKMGEAAQGASQMSHAACAHESTPAARARCRRERA